MKPRVIVKILIGLFVLYCAVCAAMFLMQERFIFHPTGERGLPADFGLTDFQRVSFTTEDGVALVGWLHRAPTADKAVVLFYGNADALPPYADFFRKFAAAGYSVLGVNYRGYGGSAGEPSELGFYRDGDAALRFLRQYAPTENTVVIGRSIGSGVAVDLAARNRVGALALISPFTSLTDVASAAFPYLPVRLLLKCRFASSDKIGKVSAPVLIVHGDADTLIPPSHGKALYDAANEPKRIEILKGADHISMDLARIFDLVAAADQAPRGDAPAR